MSVPDPRRLSFMPGSKPANTENVLADLQDIQNEEEEDFGPCHEAEEVAASVEAAANGAEEAGALVEEESSNASESPLSAAESDAMQSACVEREELSCVKQSAAESEAEKEKEASSAVCASAAAAECEESTAAAASSSSLVPDTAAEE